MALAIDLRVIAAVVYALVVAFLLFKFRRHQLLAGVLCFAAVLAWWLTLKPSNDRPWQPDNAQTAYAVVHGNIITIHNLRNCDYRTESDYSCQWLTRTVDLNQIDGVDLFMNYWGSPLIAHTILSFHVRGEQPIAFSIETRQQIGQDYSAVLGFFR